MKTRGGWIVLGIILACLYWAHDREPLAGWLQAILPHAKAVAPAPLPESERAEVSSPEGTSTTVVNKTFAISKTTEFSFDVPPHAANPSLRGTYESFAGSDKVSDENADVELLVLNQSQYEELRQGEPSNVVFSAAAAHDQDVNFTLPGTMESPVKYYLVFRSAPGGDKRKIVKANFHVDF